MNNTENQWHLKKEISIGQIIAIITMALGAIASWSQMDKRVTVIEREIIHSQESDIRIENLMKDSVVRIEAAVIRIEVALRDKADKK